MKPFFPWSDRVEQASAEAMKLAAEAFARIDANTEYNQNKVLKAFIDHRVSERHFTPTTGYGYGDAGRDTLDQVFAQAFGCEDALVRHSFASGTHTLAVALFGLLRPGDTLLSVTGTPYDTIHDVMGITGAGMGSLRDYGIHYRQVDLDGDGRLDPEAIAGAVNAQTTVVYLQRSRGYTMRPSLSTAEIGAAVKLVKGIKPDVIVMVDNCYGEFAERQEPCQAGADLIAGSLIKNAGGGVARSGGYIAGRGDLVERVSYRMTAPGVGREIGASLGHNGELYMGLFHAPHVVGEALKSAVYFSALFRLFGCGASPAYDEERYDIIQCLSLGSPEALVTFCQGIQSGSPVDSFVVPEPADMPGYDSQVVMAAGAFTGGSSIELSADAPMRPPYSVWVQGGLNFHSAKTCANLALEKMLEKGLL